MPQRSESFRSRATHCALNEAKDGAPLPLPDLFGYVPPASPTESTNTGPTSRRKPAAEWPAGSGRGPLASPAPDRPAEPPPRPPRVLSGTYALRGSMLDRGDGVTLWLHTSRKPELGRTDAPRTVRLGYPGGGKPAFISGLYDRGGDPRDPLDGTAFEHGETGRWYRIARAGEGAYRVSPIRRRRGTGS